MDENGNITQQDNSSPVNSENIQQNNIQNNEQPVQNPYQQSVQNPYQQQTQNPYQQPVQNPYEQQIQSPYQANTYQPVAENVPVKKKGKKALIAVLIVVGVIALGIGSAFVFAGDYMKNLIARYTKSDADYFVWVERNNHVPMEDSEEMNLNTYLDQLTAMLEQGIKSDTELSVKVGGALADMLGVTGLGRVGVKQDTEYRDGALDLDATLVYEGTDVISLEALLDFAQAKGYFRLPELSDAYIDFSEALSYLDGQNVAGIIESIPEFLKSFISTEKLSADFINECTEKYYFKSLELVENIEKINSEKFVIGEEGVTCTKVTVDVTADDLKRIGKYLVETMANDDVLLDYIVSFIPNELNVNKSDIADGLKELVAELEKSDEVNASESLFMIDIYVNRTGKIIGRNIRVNSDKGEISIVYGNFSEGEDINFNASVKMAGLNIAKVSSKGTNIDGKLNGRATIEVPMASLIFGTASSKFAIYIDYSDMVTKADSLSGNIALSVEAPENMELLDDLSLADFGLLFNYDIQKNSVNFSLSATYKNDELINVVIANSLDMLNGSIRLPDSSSKVIEYTDDDVLAEEFTLGKVLTFVQDTQAKLNDPYINELIENLLYSVLPNDPIDDPGVIVDPDPWVDPDPIVEPDSSEIDTTKNYYYTYENLADYITLGDYKGLEIDVDCTVNDEEIDEYIQNERLYSSKSTNELEGGIQKDDIIFVDYSVSVLGIELEDYSETDTYITIGSEWNDEAVKMFEEYVIGKNIGDVVEVSVEIPESFGDFVAGIKADVTINIKDATRYILPEYDIEFVKSKGFDSIEEYEADVRTTLEQEKFAYSEYMYVEKLLDMIYSSSDVREIPESLYQQEVERLRAYYENMAIMSGSDLDTYLETTLDMTNEEFDEVLRYEANYNFTTKIVYAGIARANNIYLSGEDYKRIIEDKYLGGYYWETYENLLEYYTEQQLVDEIIEDEMNEYLLEISVLNGAP